MSEERVSLMDVLRRLQVVRAIDAILEDQYRAEEEAKLAREKDENIRSETFHQSFHASSFPLADSACARKALYSMMALPADEPVSRYGRAIMESGEHIEDRIVARFRDAGVLLSRNDGPGKQTNFRHSDYWLTGFVDSIINLNSAVHVVEIKSKKHAHVEEMRSGTRKWDEQHRGQAMTYIWFARMAHEVMGWDKLGLTKCKSASILYVSRDAPGYTAEFWIDWDEAEFNAALEKLRQWKQWFIDKYLPKREKGLYWTKPPCQWCDFKGPCKEDDKSGCESLTESAAVERAKQVISNYDFDQVWEGVLSSWGVEHESTSTTTSGQ